MLHRATNKHAQKDAYITHSQIITNINISGGSANVLAPAML